MQIRQFRTTTKKATRQESRQARQKANLVDQAAQNDEPPADSNTARCNRFASTLPKSDSLQLSRKYDALKTITINYDLASRLEAVARNMGKPKRWIAEQSIRQMAETEAAGYTPRDLSRLAHHLIA